MSILAPIVSFDFDCIDTIDQFEENCCLNSLSLPIHEYEISSHLFLGLQFPLAIFIVVFGVPCPSSSHLFVNLCTTGKDVYAVLVEYTDRNSVDSVVQNLHLCWVFYLVL